MKDWWAPLILVAGLAIGAVAIYAIVYKPSTQQAVAYKPVAMSNESIIQWIDYKGRKREITIHREIKEHEQT